MGRSVQEHTLVKRGQINKYLKEYCQRNQWAQWTVAKYKIEIDAPENRNFWFASRIDFAFHFFYVIHWYKNCVETRIKVVQLGCGIYKFLLTPHRTSTSTTSAGDTTGRVLYTSTVVYRAGLVVLYTVHCGLSCRSISTVQPNVSPRYSVIGLIFMFWRM